MLIDFATQNHEKLASEVPFCRSLRFDTILEYVPRESRPAFLRKFADLEELEILHVFPGEIDQLFGLLAGNSSILTLSIKELDVELLRRAFNELSSLQRCYFSEPKVSVELVSLRPAKRFEIFMRGLSECSTDLDLDSVVRVLDPNFSL